MAVLDRDTRNNYRHHSIREDRKSCEEKEERGRVRGGGGREGQNLLSRYYFTHRPKEIDPQELTGSGRTESSSATLDKIPKSSS